MDTYEFLDSETIAGMRRKMDITPKNKRYSPINVNAFNKELILMKIKYPFLTESQIGGRTLDKFGIPNILGMPYKVNRKTNSIIKYSIPRLISEARATLYRNNDKQHFKRRTEKELFTPLDIITNKSIKNNKSKISKNLCNAFTLYSEEQEMLDDNYSIESLSDSGKLEEYGSEQTFSKWERQNKIIFNNIFVEETTKKYGRKRLNDNKSERTGNRRPCKNSMLNDDSCEAKTTIDLSEKTCSDIFEDIESEFHQETSINDDFSSMEKGSEENNSIKMVHEISDTLGGIYDGTGPKDDVYPLKKVTHVGRKSYTEKCYSSKEEKINSKIENGIDDRWKRNKFVKTMVTNETPSKIKTIYVRKMHKSTEKNNSDSRKMRAENYLILRDNRNKAESDIPQTTLLNVEKQNAKKITKNIKQSISIISNEDVKIISNNKFKTDQINNFNIDDQNTLKNMNATEDIKTQMSRESLKYANDIESQKNKIIKKLKQEQREWKRSPILGMRHKKHKKSSECIIQMKTDTISQTDSIYDDDRNSITEDIEIGPELIGSSFHNISQRSKSSLSEESCLGDAVTFSPNNISIRNDDEPSHSQLSEDSSAEDDYHSRNSFNRSLEFKSSQGSSICDGKMSPQYIDPVLSEGNLDEFLNSEGISRARSENSESPKIDEDGYFLANLFDHHTNFPQMRTLRSSTAREQNTDNDYQDNPMVVI